MRLHNKIALISGTARGIGLAIAQAFRAEGASVWLSDIDVEAGERATAALGAQARFVRMDVRDEADWR